MTQCRQPLLLPSLLENGREAGSEPLLPSAAAAEPPARRRPALLAAACCALLLVLAGLAFGVHTLQHLVAVDGDVAEDGWKAQQPFCRKSCSMAVLLSVRRGAAAAEGSDSVGGGGASGPAEQHPQLVVWSGIGKHKAIFDDTWRFDLASRTWKALRLAKGPAPVSRWKAGNAQAVQNGLLVVAGDAYKPGTRHHHYTSDVWRLDWGSLAWERGRVDPSAPCPLPRRGHSTAHYTDAHGVDHVILFAGRTQDKSPLNDAWELTLSWPNATWRELAPLQPAGERAPKARRGHSAVIVPHPETPQMLVFGGREDMEYYGDLWLLDLASGRWALVEPATGVAPSKRDHHTAAFFRGELVVFGGRTGPSYDQSKPVNDLWVFNLKKREWRQVEQQGEVPIPRFEEAYFQYQPPGSTEDSRMLMFGGQTEHVCQLNDLWELDLETFTWTQLSPPRFCTAKCRRRYQQAGAWGRW